jgi:hypothetical protein
MAAGDDLVILAHALGDLRPYEPTRVTPQPPEVSLRGDAAPASA